MMSPQFRPSSRSRTPIAVEEIDPALLREPLEFLFAEHYRQRAVLNHLDWLAREGAGEARAKIVRMVLHFLRADLPHHIADEEEDLFPLLRARCEADDRIEAVFEILVAEHAADQQLVKAVVDGLKVLMPPHAPPNAALRAAIRAFVETQRRHLAWENALILPLARKRLSAADLVALGQRMAARRKVAYPSGAGEA